MATNSWKKLLVLSTLPLQSYQYRSFSSPSLNQKKMLLDATKNKPLTALRYFVYLLESKNLKASQMLPSTFSVKETCSRDQIAAFKLIHILLKTTP